jgi:hypothetical protein
MTLLTSIPEIGTAEETAATVAQLAANLGIPGEPPDVRTLRLWRTKKQLTIAGRNFTRRNVLEVLVMHKLRQAGMTTQSAGQRVRALDEERLQAMLIDASSVSVPRTDFEPIITLQLLAKGIIEQYQLVAKGAIVGHTDAHKTGITNTPLSLQQAMARLARHYLTEQQEDRASSVHHLLQLCTLPLHTWAPQALVEIEPYQQAVLIDPHYLVPNEDCEAIAEEADGTNLSDLVEHHLHNRLRMTLAKLGNDADAAYSIVREFIGRHPMATRTELQHLFLNPELTNEVIDFVRSLYAPIHTGNVQNGMIQRCAHCQGLIGEDGLCVLSGCQQDYPVPRYTLTAIAIEEAFIARPEVLKFWSDPAREELRLYDELRKSQQLRDRVSLYPYSDRCDVAVDEDVGVDVKDYQDPVRLARRLNRSIGGLEYYSDRILAIAERRWSPLYRDRLMEQLSQERRDALRVLRVDDAITYVKRTYGGGRRASKA